jgi:tetratricopeptide (TPR) repeat protein
MPSSNSPSTISPFLEKAIRAALATGNPGALEAELREEMKALPGVEDPESAAHAARLYITSVLDALWRIEALRDAVRDVLFKEHVEALRRLEEKLDRFLEWWRLPRVRERLPREELVHGPQRDIGFAALKAPLALVPFTGKRHRALRDELVEWARSLGGSPGRAGLRVLCGPGGAGKTRLAVETAAVLLGQGWEAFFLTPELLRLREPQKNLMPVLHHLFVPPRPTLYVVDYVDHLPEAALRAVFRALYETGGSRRRPVALIFLMRPRPDPEWLGELIGLAEAEPGFSAFLTGTVLPAFNGAEGVPELSPDDRVSLFERAKEAFIGLRGEAPGESVDYPPEALPQRPLAIVLLGLLAAYGRRVPQSESEMAVLKHVWDCWEKDKWSKVLRRNDGLPRELIADALDHIEVTLIAATLGRRFRTPGEVAAFWKGHYHFRHRDPTGRAVDPDWLAGVLPDLFPSPGPRSRWLLPPIAPDPLADLVLARRGDLGKLARAALPTAEELRGAWERLRDVLSRSREVDIEEVGGYPFFVAPFRALPVLRRLFNVHPEAGRLLARALADWLEETARDLPKEAAALWLGLWKHHLPEGPEHTVALRELFVAYCRARLHWATEDRDRALWLNNLGVALSALGRHKEALEATREAVDLYRELVKKNPDRFLPDLARSLGAHGYALLGAGRAPEAAEAFREGLGALIPHARRLPRAFGPLLDFLLQSYRRACEAAGRAPDDELVWEAEKVLKENRDQR